jgi:arylsulfatase A-like enzyme
MTSAPVGYDESSRRAVLSGYFAAVTAMDANIGRILDWVEERGIREETIIFFTSDNGMNMGHHGIYGKGNGTFPQNMFDTSVKVPAIISHPGSIPSDAVCEALVSHYDYMPTILDLLDLDATSTMPDKLPGRSAKQIIRGEEPDVHDHVVVYNEYGPVRMIRDREWKYVHRYPHGPHELYNLEDDPDERLDLFGVPSYQEKVEELRGKLEEWFVSYVDPRVDATREAITGRGQNGPTGVYKEGREVFSDDFVFYYDDKAQSIGFSF